MRVERSRGRLSLKWASATALRGYGYVIQALGPRRQRLVGLIKLAVDLTPDSAAHFRVGPAVAERRRRRMLGMDVESTGSCPAPSAGGASSGGGPSASGGSPSDASGGAGPAGPNEADEDDDEEEEGDDDDLLSGASECSGSITGTIDDVFEVAKRCLAELEAAHERGDPIRLVELQAAVLARCPRYSTEATRTIAPCTDADFAAAHDMLRAVAAELRRLKTRVIDNMQRGLTVYDM